MPPSTIAECPDHAQLDEHNHMYATLASSENQALDSPRAAPKSTDHWWAALQFGTRILPKHCQKRRRQKLYVSSLAVLGELGCQIL